MGFIIAKITQPLGLTPVFVVGVSSFLIRAR
jgi:hypothetical protein